MNWAEHYPAFAMKDKSGECDSKSEDHLTDRANHVAVPQVEQQNLPKITKDVEVADIGCGYGGLLIALSQVLPDKLILGKSSAWT